MAKQTIGMCRLCGEHGKLTQEHVPPEAAFNDFRVVMQSMRSTPWGVRRQLDHHQHGVKHPVLCEPCNNLTGHWYGADYVRFAHDVAPLARPEMRGKRPYVSMARVRPARVLKQVITMMCATGGLGFKSAEEWQDLQRFVLEPTATLPFKGMRFYCYIVARGLGRSTGMVSVSGLLAAEVAWWPLGWAVGYGDVALPGLYDVTRWSEFAIDDTCPLSVPIPACATATEFPLDFRDSDEVQRGVIDNLTAAGHAINFDEHGDVIVPPHWYGR